MNFLSLRPNTVLPRRANHHSTHGVTPELRQAYWLNILCRHGLLPQEVMPQTSVHANNIEGQICSGYLGLLRYSSLSIKSLALHFPKNLQTPPGMHWVVMQLTGRTTYTTHNKAHDLIAGDVMLINQQSNVKRIEHHGQSDMLILHNPLTPTAEALMQHVPFSTRHLSCELARIVFKLCQDLMPTRVWSSGTLAEDLGFIVSTLLGHVFNQLPDPLIATPRNNLLSNKVNRLSIEKHVRSRLEDSTLSLASIAQAMGCSIRTLHRAFEGDSSDSLEGHIWKLRIEACAELLRQPNAQDIPLTDLALKFGFSNSSHFSSVFRRRMGTSPSDYRRAHQPAETNPPAATNERDGQLWSV